MDSITDRLAAAIAPMLESGTTQAELARQIGVTRATLGDWLHKRSATLRAETLFAAADTLGVEARWLATGKGPRERVRLGAEERAMLAAFAALTPAERITLRTLANQLAEARADYRA